MKATITFEVNNKIIELTLAEAKKLRNDLHELLSNTSTLIDFTYAGQTTFTSVPAPQNDFITVNDSGHPTYFNNNFGVSSGGV